MPRIIIDTDKVLNETEIAALRQELIVTARTFLSRCDARDRRRTEREAAAQKAEAATARLWRNDQ